MTQTAKRLANEVFIARADQLKRVRTLVRNKLSDVGCEPVFISRMVLAVNEACMNIIQHAYSGTQDGEFSVEILLNNSLLTFRVTDSAPPIDKKTITGKKPDEIRPGGLGVFFIHEIMDHVEFLDVSPGIGNILEMKKRMTQVNS